MKKILSIILCGTVLLAACIVKADIIATTGKALSVLEAPDGTPCPQERELLDKDGVVIDCCSEGKFAVENFIDGADPVSQGICCDKKDVVGVNGTCCLSGLYSFAPGHKFECCGSNKYARPYRVLAGGYEYLMCCDRETDIVADQKCYEQEKVRSYITNVGNHANVTMYVCCSNSTDELIDKKCCPKERVGSSSDWYTLGFTESKFCCPEGQVWDGKDCVKAVCKTGDVYCNEETGKCYSA